MLSAKYLPFCSGVILLNEIKSACEGFVFISEMGIFHEIKPNFLAILYPNFDGRHFGSVHKLAIMSVRFVVTTSAPFY